MRARVAMRSASNLNSFCCGKPNSPRESGNPRSGAQGPEEALPRRSPRARGGFHLPGQVAFYRGFNSFASSVGLGVFCHNLITKNSSNPNVTHPRPLIPQRQKTGFPQQKLFSIILRYQPPYVKDPGMERMSFLMGRPVKTKGEKSKGSRPFVSVCGGREGWFPGQVVSRRGSPRLPRGRRPSRRGCRSLRHTPWSGSSVPCG